MLHPVCLLAPVMTARLGFGPRAQTPSTLHFSTKHRPTLSLSFHCMVAGRQGVEALLRASLVHVPENAFSLAAIRKTLLKQQQNNAAAVDRALSVLFPGPDPAPTSAPRRLFQAWDDRATMHINGVFEEKEKNSMDVTVQWLCDRLAYNDPVRPHLLPVRVMDTYIRL